MLVVWVGKIMSDGRLWLGKVEKMISTFFKPLKYGIIMVLRLLRALFIKLRWL